MKQLCLAIVAVLSVFLYAYQEEPPRITVEALEQQGQASLVIQTDVPNASVYVNNFYRGIAPLALSGLKPDTYLITIAKEGYKKRSLSLNLSSNTKTTVYMNLIPATGYLSIMSPQKLELVINGKTYEGNFIELPEGKYTCRARAFGFEDEFFDIEILYNKTTYHTVTLSPAQFTVQDFNASNIVFNPRNAGMYGFSIITFTVTTYGYAHISITNETGNLILDYNTPVFDTWGQTVRWNGKDHNGTIMPDGKYTVAITCYDTSKGESQLTHYYFEQLVTIDSSLVFYPEPSGGLAPGSFYAPSILPPLSFSFKTSTGISYGTTGSFEEFGVLSFIIKALLTIPGIGKFAVGASIGTEPEMLMGSFGCLIPVVTGKTAGGGIALTGVIQSPKSGGSNIRAGIPITLGTHELSVTVQPGLMLTFLSSQNLNGYAEFAVQYVSFKYTAALSGRLATSNLLSENFSITLPAQVVFDFVCIPTESFIELGFWTSLDFKESFTDVSAGLHFTMNLLNGN